jgi:two-component system, OmpR family, sensor histidine kinase TctE
MWKPKPRSLRRQLLYWLLALLLPLLAIGALNSYYRAYHFANLAYDRSLFRAALALADQVEVAHGVVVVDLPKKALDLLEYDKDDWIYYRVTDPHGNTVTGEPELPLPPIPPGMGEHVFYDADFAGQKLRITAFSLPLAGTSARGAALIQVAETKSKRDLLAEEIITAMMLPQLLIVFVAGLMIHYGVRRGLAPLDRLRHAIEQRSHRDLSSVAFEDTPREVQPLLRSMNDLLHRLRQAIAIQQRFIADASHQLRTPLAGLQTQAEMALRETNPDSVRHALEQINTSTARLSHLVKQLLSLARVEPGSRREDHLHPLDLVALARATTAEWVTAALAKQIDLGFEASPNPAIINGDDVMLGEMLSNLLDNAIRYTPPGGEITVRVETANDETVLLLVEDNGIGIPEESRELVFERFHRLPDSGSEGCGLGLAIVREITHAHQGEISIRKGADGQGTCVAVTFPHCLNVSG